MQNLRRIIARSVALSMSIIMITTTAIFASPMKDVPANHWAYNSIMEMQRRGLLVASSQGEFKPNKIVTYFELSEILAKATGYQDASVNPNMDATLKKEISDNYIKQKPIIEAHAKKYKHWQQDTNQEIAYLLGRGYLEKEDLSKFMSKSTTGVESKRGVRKQEATVYLVRIMHMAKTAQEEYVSTGFVDESAIQADYRPYVSYMKEKKIVNGDEAGKFNPAQPITRAILSKMLVDTLEIKETPLKPDPEPQPEAEKPADKALEGTFTKMISKGDGGGYYIVLEVEPGRTHTYSIEQTASVLDQDGKAIALADLKKKIDAKDGKDVIGTAQVELIKTTEHITSIKLMNVLDDTPPVETEKPEKPEPEKPKPRPEPEDKEEEEEYTGELTGSVHSILIGPKSEITIQVNSSKRETFKITFDTKMYSDLRRNNISLWDIRLNQEVEITVVDGEVEVLDVTKAAPAMTLTGIINKVSANGDEIEMSVSYNPNTQEVNKTRIINVPMSTQILDGTTEKGRKDLKKGMEIVVKYDEDEDVTPKQIIILSK